MLKVLQNVTDVNPPYGKHLTTITEVIYSILEMANRKRGVSKICIARFKFQFPPRLAAGSRIPDLLVSVCEVSNRDAHTSSTGKLFNAHTVDNYNKPHVAGFNGSDFLLDPYTYQYLNSTFQRNHDPPVRHLGEYSTDVLASKAYGLLDDAAATKKPFFLAIAPNAPHSNVAWTGDGTLNGSGYSFSAPVSAERHKHLFKDVKVPRTTNFNPENPSGVNWIRSLRRQSEENVAYNDHFYRQRLRALQAVDELVDGVFARLKSHNLLDNTYIIYTADNGYHIGQHRLQPGKECGFEEDINVPLIIRGPGVAEKLTTELVTTHTDLAPTILNLIGEKPRPDFDGAAIPVHSAEISVLETHSKAWHEHVNVEYWGFAIGEGQYESGKPYLNNTYKALRIVGKHYNLYYSVWCNNVHELYNLNTDPGQLENLLSSSSNLESTIILDLPVSKVASRLDSLLFVLKSCKGDQCVNPWKALHPDGEVSTLKDALKSQFDTFYETEQIRIKYDRCEAGYIIGAEGPQFETDGLVYRDGLKWSEWV
jgi:arylsulfatase A-like enzyme